MDDYKLTEVVVVATAATAAAAVNNNNVMMNKAAAATTPAKTAVPANKPTEKKSRGGLRGLFSHFGGSSNKTNKKGSVSQ